ncbi:uncharacterized protein METZ01_LOCUS343924, partial [marine metagenome]
VDDDTLWRSRYAAGQCPSGGVRRARPEDSHAPRRWPVASRPLPGDLGRPRRGGSARGFGHVPGTLDGGGYTADTSSVARSL